MQRRFVASHRSSRPLRYLARRCARFLDQFENANDQVWEANGELRVLQRLAHAEIRCVLDGGANVGAWARRAHDILPAATVHCFEIVPQIAAELRERVGDLKRIVVNDVGLYDGEGDVPLSYYPELSVLSTVTAFPHDMARREITGRTTTGDAYLAERGLRHVDFLKLDVEGAEPLALRGFGRAFAESRINVVQFEYGQVSILTKFLLRDFHRFFEERGFLVGKIYPAGVEFRSYEFAHEDFRGANFLAVRRDRQDLIAAVR